jgi:hypothetical protein
MEPDNLRFGGGAAETAIHPLIALLLLISIALLFFLPRAKGIAVFLLTYFTIPMGQVVVLGGFHFTALRILTFAGLGRMIVSGKSSSEGTDRFPGGFNAIDQVVVLWSAVAVIAFYLQYMETQALVRIMGDCVDGLGGYLVVRFFITDREAVRSAIKALAVVCAIQGVCMINERISHINVFGLLGGIPVEVTIRDGRIRAAGVMGCLYAGAFAGVLVPVFVWLWTEGKSRMLAFAGIAGAIAMVITSNASTSLMALAGGIVGLAFWPLRKQMRLVRWGVAGMLLSLHMVMKAPVWALIGRIDLTGSSSGEHREALFDQCVKHFWDWWLIGTPHYNDWGWGMWDLCNQFVAVAETGGLLALICYIAIFKRSFSALGNTRKLVDGDRAQEWFLWCLGADLFATVVGCFGINSVPQILMGFFPLLACISVTVFYVSQGMAVKAEIPGDSRLASLAAQPALKLPIAHRVPRVHPR